MQRSSFATLAPKKERLTVLVSLFFFFFFLFSWKFFVSNELPVTLACTTLHPHRYVSNTPSRDEKGM